MFRRLPRMLPEECSVALATPDATCGGLAGRLLASSARRAWDNRFQVLTLDVRPEEVRRFLILAAERRHGPFSLVQAATEMGTTVRTLHRFSLHSLGFPPGTILGLVRAWSIACDLIETELDLDSIATRHGFSEASALSRQFLRFAGTRPGAYRRHLAQRPSRDGARRPHRMVKRVGRNGH